jgi:tetratricopeptide (TPR) repeat protein
MAEITVDESWRQIRKLTDRAEQAAEERRWTDAVERWRDVLAHPCAHHQVVAYEVLDDIHQAWRAAGRYDDAIAAKREAIAAGYRSVPDPEADIAECLLAAGRRDQADALFAELRGRDPEDVWLYNSAAYSYADVDIRASLRWALEGIEVALATGDPDQVAMQLLECAEAAWEALDEQVERRSWRGPVPGLPRTAVASVATA